MIKRKCRLFYKSLRLDFIFEDFEYILGRYVTKIISSISRLGKMIHFPIGKPCIILYF